MREAGPMYRELSAVRNVWEEKERERKDFNGLILCETVRKVAGERRRKDREVLLICINLPQYHLQAHYERGYLGFGTRLQSFGSWRPN